MTTETRKHCGCMDLGNGVTTNPCALCRVKKESSLADRAIAIAWPHTELLEPRAADTLVENIAQALRAVERDTLERVLVILDAEEAGWRRGDVNYPDGLPQDIKDYKNGGWCAVKRIRTALIGDSTT